MKRSIRWSRQFSFVVFAAGLFGLTSLLAPGAAHSPLRPLVAQLDAQAGPQLSRRPYLQAGTPTGVVIRWRSTTATDSVVDYGPDPANLIASARNSTPTTNHEIELSALQPGTKYYYAVGSTTQRLAGGDATHFFVTSPPVGTPLPTRIWVLGDSGTGDAKAEAVRNAYYSFAGSTFTNLWLMLGDNAYNDGFDSEYQSALFDMYPWMLQQSVLWPTKGNHDNINYYDVFTLPMNGQAGGVASGTEAYYSFDYANVHFICLNSYDVDLSTGGPMLTWLQNDIASTAQRWIVAYWHHPPYSKGSHDSDVDFELTEMRQNALPILEAGGVDLVLTGHSHSYERSFLIDGHYGRSDTFVTSMKVDGGSGAEGGSGAYHKPSTSPAPHSGTVYAVAGSSGNTSGGTLDHPAMFTSQNVMGSLVLDVNDGRLDVRFVDDQSTVRDAFTILKDPIAPLAVTTTTLPNGATGVGYLRTLAATGGHQPYIWSIAAGSLPAGLTLTPATGVISGTPTTPGTSAFTVRVTDSAAPSATADRPLSISIASQATVPNVVGLTQAAASTAIVNAGLTVGAITTAASATVPVGSVISQNPAAATQAVVGSAVALVVSSGPPPVTVPNVVGLTQSAASTAITNAGLLVGAVTTGSSTTVPAGSVISQTPNAGAVVASGSAVALLVSSGPSGPPAVLSIDKTVSVDGIGTVTTPTFSTTDSNELLVLFASSAGPTSTSSKQTLTISGASLAWTLAIRSNGQFGTSEIWTANAPTPVTNGAITSVQGLTNSYHQSLTLIAFKGAGGSGAVAATSASFGPTTISLTTTRAASVVYATANDSARAAARTMGASQVMVHQWVDTAGAATFWVQTLAAPVANAGTSATINDTSPTSDRWNAAAIEILVGTAAFATVPNVVGLTQSAASTAITTAGLTVGTVTTASSTTVPAGTVISQNPTAGTQIASGSAVALVVSSGSPQVAVPNVVGLTQSAASTAITTAGLTVGTVTTASSTTVPAGSVISQNPTAGTQIASGSAVALVVSSGSPQVAVPNVVGLTQSAASTAITTAGLTVGTVTTASSTTVPAGTVISQNPTAGTQIASGSAVALVVSSGSPQVAVPNVVGLTQSAASTAITTAGLIVGTITTASSTTVPSGSVISQNPTAATQVATGSAVALVVSSGPPQVAVPNVVGLTQSAASTAITTAGLTVGTVTTASSTTVPAGSVISQNPTAGTQIASGSAVALVVSSGPPQVAVPSVVGLTQSAASTAITNAGLIVGTITTASSTTVPSGSVISQTPTAATQVATGSAVALVVSSGPPQVAVPNVVGLTQSAASTAITAVGLVVGTIANASSATVPAGAVISQSPVAGTLALPGSAVSLVVSTGPAGASPIVDQVVFSDGRSTRTTSPFSTTAANELLLAFVASDGPSPGSQTVTVTGAGLTWTLVRRANTQAGTAEVWQAQAASPLTNVTVKSTQSQTAYRQSLTVVTFRGASGVGASAVAGAASGAPNVTLQTTRANSLVYGVGNDWDRAVARTLGANQLMVHQAVVTAVGDTFWVQSLNAPVSAAGTSAQISCTAPTNDQWNLVSVEIVP